MPTDPTPLATALDLSGQVVLVTGGTKGVGLGIVRRFLEAGADVAVTARNAPEEPIGFAGRQATFFPCDVRDPEQVQGLISAVVDRHGRLDHLVNNAGGSPPADAATASPRFSEAIIKLNLLAPLYLAQAAHGPMVAQDTGGSIINIGSLSGARPSPGSAAYGAAKAGLRNLSLSLAMEWAPAIRVNLVTVGYVATEKVELFYGDEDGQARVAATIPMGRMAAPTDVGDACVYLASPLARHVTGADLAVHGGGEPPPFLAAAEG